MEREPSNIGRREFLKNLGGAVVGGVLAGSALGSGEKKAPGENSEREKASKEKLISELLAYREITPNQGKEFLQKVEYWHRQHARGGANYQALLGGWNRLLDSNQKTQSDLETILDIFKKEGVPKDLIFLGLAESYWNKNAYNKNSKAGGPWQFIPDTAKRFGLKDRYNIVESTKAACVYLKELYALAQECAELAGVQVSASDLWLWAFLAYNRGEGFVLKRPSGKRGDFFRFGGDINEYVKNCKVKESVNYPTKILGIAKALEDFIE